ncbi:MAG: peptidylprolyl isomerase [Verrucomicrobiota bacterium]|nr:MAG: peptidylprolyl isomerase [Verrucomicrobiota bacterium]
MTTRKKFFAFLFRESASVLEVMKAFGQAVLCFAGFMVGAWVSAEESDVVYFNNIEAEVEGTVVTFQEVEMEAAMLEPQFRGDEARKKALNSHMEREVIVREFERNKGRLPDNYVQKKYDEILKTKFGDDRTRLASALYARGMTKRDYEEEIRKDAIEGYMFSHNVMLPSMVSPREIQDYYDAHVSEMVDGERATFDQVVVTDENRLSLEAVVANVAQGKASDPKALYEETCAKLRETPEVVLNTMESVSLSDIQPEIAECVKSMDLNTFQRVEVGEHALWIGLRSREPSRSLPIDEVSDDIKNILIGQQSEKLKKHWIEGLMAKAYHVVR